MIITFHTKKGGAGKSSSILSLCSVLAEINAAREKPYRFCVIDADVDVGTSRRFQQAREKLGLPDYGITFQHLAPVPASRKALAALKSQHEFVLVDMPGAANPGAVMFALESDMIVVPTALAIDEVGRAVEMVNMLNEVIARGQLDTRVAMLVTRCAANYQFETTMAKEVFRHLHSSGLPMLQATLPLEPAVRESCDRGLYLFELKQEQSRSKSAERAHRNAEHLLDACINHKIMKPALEGGENA